MTRIYDLAAPICIENGSVRLPKPKSAEINIKTIGHDLILSGMKIFRYLSNIIYFDFHMGTHFDVPAMFAYDSFNIDEIPLEFFIREVFIVNVEHGESEKPLKVTDISDKIDEELFKSRPKDKRPALILRTGYSKYWCVDNIRYMRFPGFSRDLIEYIAYKLEPPFIGIDAISVDRTIEYRSLSLYPEVDDNFIEMLREQEYTPFLNHDVLLRNNILILENMYLNDLPPNVTEGLLLAIPLFRYRFADTTRKPMIAAIPCRPVLITPIPQLKDAIAQLRMLEKILSSMSSGRLR